ncbi:hypothetical protein [Arthrobacter sp. TMN-50]
MTIDNPGTSATEHARPPSVEEWLARTSLSFSPADLIDALENLQNRNSGANLPARDRTFWEAHSGLSATRKDVARSSAHSTAARVLGDATSHSAADVANRLGLSPSTIRHYKAERKLFSYLINGRIVFPDWQFTPAGKVMPRLDLILGALPELHPQAVAGFFLTPQPDLELDGEPVTVKAWLEAGGTAEPVLNMAAALAVGY